MSKLKDTFLLKQTIEEREITRHAAEDSGLKETWLIKAAVLLAMRNPERWYAFAAKMYGEVKR